MKSRPSASSYLDYSLYKGSVIVIFRNNFMVWLGFGLGITLGLGLGL